MRKKLTTTVVFAAAAPLALVACGGGSDDGAASLEGETIEFVVPFSPGGGYDSYARQLAPALAEELGATVTVVNQPGAGGLQATNQMFVAEGDGTTFAILNAVGALGSELAEADGVQYEAEQFSYIGRLNQEPNVVTTRSDGPLASLDDVLDQSGTLRFGATGPGSLEYIDAALLQEVFELDSEVVSGFEGSGEVRLALLAGDLDLHSLSLSSQLTVIESGDARPLLIVGDEGVEGMEDVPTLVEAVTDEDKADLVNNHVQLLESGRLIAGPPEMDPEVLQQLRDAFEAVVTDEEYMAAAAQAGRPIDFASGEDLEGIVSQVMDADDRYVEVLKRAFDS